MKIFLSIFSLLLVCSSTKNIHSRGDDILGKWMNNAKNNLEVEIYKTGDEYKARVIWFDDSDDKSRPMVGRLDIENPDETLRTRESAWTRGHAWPQLQSGR